MKIWKERYINEFFKENLCEKSVENVFADSGGYIAVNVAATDLSVKSAVLGLAVSAVSAGVAAVMNLKEEK